VSTRAVVQTLRGKAPPRYDPPKSIVLCEPMALGCPVAAVVVLPNDSVGLWDPEVRCSRRRQ
jgi:hypothetical protein